jgi:hypothetical protein
MDDHSHEIPAAQPKPNYAVAATVLVLFTVGLAITLAVGRYPEVVAAGEADGRHAAAATKAAATKPLADANVTSLFDGKTLGKWKSTEFGGEGAVEVKDGAIVVNAGGTLSGVNWTGGPLPKVDYEIELDVKKISGSDFLLGLTFPYKNDFATFVLGGWGGALVGISNVNGNDAASNEYSTAKEFPKGHWFHVRLRCTDKRIQGWIGDAAEPILDVDTTDKTISTRSDIDQAKPLGLSTYQTAAAYKNIVLRKL